MWVVLRYTAARILWTIPTMLVVVTLLFFMLRSIGGSPLRHGPFLGLSAAVWTKYGDPQPDAIATNMTRKYGLDKPLPVQYWRYLKTTSRGDFGQSTKSRQPVVEEFKRRFPATRSRRARPPRRSRRRPRHGGC